MKKYPCILLIVFAGAISASEPTYHGKKLSDWLEDLTSYQKTLLAREAITEMGTNALPYLINMIQARAAIELTNSQIGAQLMRAFQALGLKAVPSIPELTDLLNQPNTSVDAALALATIGPRTMSVLTNAALMNTNQTVRTSANYGVMFLNAEIQSSFGTLGKEPEIAIPILVEKLSDTNAMIRTIAVGYLGRFGKRAKSVVPQLVKALNDVDQEVRSTATNTLKLIDAEAASKAGIN